MSTPFRPVDYAPPLIKLHLIELKSDDLLFLKSYYHMVGTGSKDDCKNGQRIHLIGRLSSRNYWTEDGKLRQKNIIKCGDLELLPEDKQQQRDLNRVELCAQISSNIDNTRDMSSFIMLTRHTPK